MILNLTQIKKLKEIISKEINNQKFFVVPVSILKNGTWSGSGGAMQYPTELMANEKEAKKWNDTPIFINHKGDFPDIDLIQNETIGRLYDMQVKQVGQDFYWIGNAYLEAEKVSSDMLQKIKNGINVSTGLLPEIENKNKVTSMHPVHLAFLPNDLGACSVYEKCGTMFNENHKETKTGEKTMDKAEMQELLANFKKELEVEAQGEKNKLETQLNEAKKTIEELKKEKETLANSVEEKAKEKAKEIAENQKKESLIEGLDISDELKKSVENMSVEAVEEIAKNFKKGDGEKKADKTSDFTGNSQPAKNNAEDDYKPKEII